MSDLTFSLPGGCFNCRVAAVIVREKDLEEEDYARLAGQVLAI